MSGLWGVLGCQVGVVCEERRGRGSGMSVDGWAWLNSGGRRYGSGEPLWDEGVGSVSWLMGTGESTRELGSWPEKRKSTNFQ